MTPKVELGLPSQANCNRLILVGIIRPYTRLFIQHNTFPKTEKNSLYISHKQIFVKTAKDDQRKISHFEQRKFR
ncbi:MULTISPECIES: hypothetical protein [Okeania]|uniref:Uncharacterized protein n=1 Tax=Okeania hirsuta TaxID=1458930 RepID=A0A3N6PTL6_9CYAN|nr:MULTISPECIES: hypothetical protein [Okeania]NET14960.1 hypothetical protein [Okeania sp. SIO1H6]NES79592.1 hypothetical protein [Okeania sp. SIO1H4]NES91402.1 hypothetical protein [Okeania sp. SIO2B9]NET18711.1 hypothetical protein [Okeania sp. SIO1H5]NET79993.1 hypothetical protein [Okeania sp. SIO1F9]